MTPERSRAFVTGSEGFVGQSLKETLTTNGYSIVGFDTMLDPSCDILDGVSVEKHVQDSDIIFHLAGILGTEQNHDGRPYAAVNVLGSVNVFEAAKQTGARVVFASKVNPWENMYTASKVAAEEFARTYHDLHGVDIRTAQMLNLYGPRQKVGSDHPVKAVPTFIMQALCGEPLTVFGSGEQTIDPMHVDDATKALAIMGEISGIDGETIQIGSGSDISVNALAEMILSISGSHARIEHIPMRPGEPDTPSRVVADITKMRSLLRFTPEVELKEGLKDTIDWYRHTYFN